MHKRIFGNVCCEKNKEYINTFPWAVPAVGNASQRKQAHCLSHKAIKNCFALKQYQRSALAKSQKARTVTNHFAPHLAAMRALVHAIVPNRQHAHGDCPHDWYVHHSPVRLHDTLLWPNMLPHLRDDDGGTRWAIASWSMLSHRNMWNGGASKKYLF